MNWTVYFGIFHFILVILKLTGHITLSWIWIFAPIWLPLLALVVFLTAIGITEMRKYNK